MLRIMLPIVRCLTSLISHHCQVRNILCLCFNQGERSCQSLCGGEFILGSHIIRETGNSKEGFFHINLAWSSKRCEHLYDEMQ